MIVANRLFIFGAGGHAKVVKEIPYMGDASYFVAVGDNKSRKREVEKLPDHRFATLIHPKSYVAPTATIGEGSVIMAGAIVQADARVGKHCILNSRAILDHDSVAEDYVHIAPGAIVCGGVSLGEGAFVGAGSVVIQYVRVPAWYLVKAGDTFHYSKLEPEESFWARVQKTDKCWKWVGAKNHNGYGIVSKRSGNCLAHRVSWSLLNGDIPEGQHVLHKCDVRDCVNPDHLFLGTQADNMRDMVQKGRSAKQKGTLNIYDRSILQEHTPCDVNKDNQ